MAFSQPIPRPFSEHGISVYAPPTPGVFGISNSRSWIHVDLADNIREALLNCLRSGDRTLMDCHPTGFVFENCSADLQSARRLQLIVEYDPICERHQNRSRPEVRR